MSMRGTWYAGSRRLESTDAKSNKTRLKASDASFHPSRMRGVMAEGAHLAVEDLSVYAVAVHGLQPLAWVVVTGIREGLVAEAGGQDAGINATKLPNVLGRLGGDGIIPRGVVLGRHTLLDGVRGNLDV